MHKVRGFSRAIFMNVLHRHLIPRSETKETAICSYCSLSSDSWSSILIEKCDKGQVANCTFNELKGESPKLKGLKSFIRGNKCAWLFLQGTQYLWVSRVVSILQQYFKRIMEKLSTNKRSGLKILLVNTL